MASWTRNKIGWSTLALLAIGVQAASTRAEDSSMTPGWTPLAKALNTTISQGIPSVVMVTSCSAPSSGLNAHALSSTPEFAALAQSIQFAEMPAEAYPAQVRALKITSYPTFIAYHRGSEGLKSLGMQGGFSDARQVMAWLEPLGRAFAAQRPGLGGGTPTDPMIAKAVHPHASEQGLPSEQRYSPPPPPAAPPKVPPAGPPPQQQYFAPPPPQQQYYAPQPQYYAPPQQMVPAPAPNYVQTQTPAMIVQQAPQQIILAPPAPPQVTVAMAPPAFAPVAAPPPMNAPTPNIFTQPMQAPQPQPQPMQAPQPQPMQAPQPQPVMMAPQPQPVMMAPQPQPMQAPQPQPMLAPQPQPMQAPVQVAQAPTAAMVLQAPGLVNSMLGTIGEHLARRKNPRVQMSPMPTLAQAPVANAPYALGLAPAAGVGLAPVGMGQAPAGAYAAVNAYAPAGPPVAVATPESTSFAPCNTYHAHCKYHGGPCPGPGPGYVPPPQFPAPSPQGDHSHHQGASGGHGLLNNLFHKN